MTSRIVPLAVVAMLIAGCGDSIVANPVPAGSAVSTPAGLPTDVPRPGPDLLYWPAAVAPQLENVGVWQAPPILISGANAYRSGEFLYQDFLYDDHGAEGTVPLPLPSLNLSDAATVLTSLFALPTGSYKYPTGAGYNGNAADFVELRVKPLADSTALRVTLNTLLDPSLMAFSVAIGGQEGKVYPFPFGANVTAPADFFLTVHPGDAGLVGEWTRASDGAALGLASVSVDLLRRQVEVRVPHAVWDPGRNSVRLAAGVGLWDASGHRYLLPQLLATASAPGWSGLSTSPPAFFNVAFRSAEPMPEISNVLLLLSPQWWRDTMQAQALAAGDISALYANVDFAKLADRVNDESAVPKNGPMDRILASHFETAQGVDQSVTCFENMLLIYQPCTGAYLGQLQPYAIYVPRKNVPAAGWGMTLLMHSLYAQYNQFLASNNQSQFGERGQGSVVITPLSRGVDGWYQSYAEADVFEVWADVARHYPLDASRTVVAGYSMGGVGTFRLGERYPDLFSRAQPTVGADETLLLANLRNIPVLMWNSPTDELAQIELFLPTALELDTMGYRYELDLFEPADHLTLAINDQYAPAADFLGDGLVDRNPAHVTYGIDPTQDSPDLGLVTDHAYWLSGLKPAGSGTASADVFSHGFGVGDPAASITQLGAGVLTGGTLPAMVYTRTYKTWGDTLAITVADQLDIKTSNLSALVIDVDRAHVSCNAVLAVSSNVPLTLQLQGEHCSRTMQF